MQETHMQSEFGAHTRTRVRARVSCVCDYILGLSEGEAKYVYQVRIDAVRHKLHIVHSHRVARNERSVVI